MKVFDFNFQNCIINSQIQTFYFMFINYNCIFQKIRLPHFFSSKSIFKLLSPVMISAILVESLLFGVWVGHTHLVHYLSWARLSHFSNTLLFFLSKMIFLSLIHDMRDISLFLGWSLSKFLQQQYLYLYTQSQYVRIGTASSIRQSS